MNQHKPWNIGALREAVFRGRLDDLPLFFRLSEAAGILGMDPQALRRACDRGEVKHVLRGRNRVFRVFDLVEYADPSDIGRKKARASIRR